jgi:hypothetical protein
MLVVKTKRKDVRMKGTRFLLGWFFVGVLVVVGCDGPVPGQPTPAPGGKITFAVNGGIAGFRRVLEIDPSGQASLTDRGQPVGTLQLSADRFAELQAKFTTAGFFNLKDSYDKGGVADDIYDTITFELGGRTKTVTVAEVGGKDITPQPLLDLISSLRQVEEEIRVKATPSSTP